VAAPEAIGERELLSIEDRLATWRAEAESIAGGAVRSTVLHGDPAQEIVRFAGEHEIDLVITRNARPQGARAPRLGIGRRTPRPPDSFEARLRQRNPTTPENVPSSRVP
jgi:nucleotide-binding universal stress UspA family protein